MTYKIILTFISYAVTTSNNVLVLFANFNVATV